jgi:hypothetical protein
MDAVEINEAMHLVQVNAVNRVIIECFDGRRWCIILRGRQEFILKSARQNPRAFAKIETALSEVHRLGLRNAEITFTRWNPNQATIA